MQGEFWGHTHKHTGFILKPYFCLSTPPRLLHPFAVNQPTEVRRKEGVKPGLGLDMCVSVCRLVWVREVGRGRWEVGEE